MARQSYRRRARRPLAAVGDAWLRLCAQRVASVVTLPRSLWTHNLACTPALARRRRTCACLGGSPPPRPPILGLRPRIGSRVGIADTLLPSGADNTNTLALRRGGYAVKQRMSMNAPPDLQSHVQACRYTCMFAHAPFGGALSVISESPRRCAASEIRKSLRHARSLLLKATPANQASHPTARQTLRLVASRPLHGSSHTLLRFTFGGCALGSSPSARGGSSQQTTIA